MDDLKEVKEGKVVPPKPEEKVLDEDATDPDCGGDPCGTDA